MVASAVCEFSADSQTPGDGVETALETLNGLPLSEALDELLKCCGSREWATRLAGERSFTSLEELQDKSESIWWSLTSDDWLEAFRSHPKIGERKAAITVAAEAQKWSEQEQASVGGSAGETLELLAELNQRYEAKFGYIFIVCASGKSAEEMLLLLRERLQNNQEDEIRIAASEQAKITALRIDKLIKQ
jgi:OHCU decarboxylase